MPVPEEIVVTGKRKKPKTGGEWYTFGRGVIPGVRDIERGEPIYDTSPSSLNEWGSLIPSDAEGNPLEEKEEVTEDIVDIKFSQFINEDAPGFKNTYKVSDYINTEL